MVSIFAYAIIRHQLMDIRVVIKKTLIFAGIFAAVYTVLAFFILLGQEFFAKFMTVNRLMPIATGHVSMPPYLTFMNLKINIFSLFQMNIHNYFRF
jgi:hypothetical protein